MDIPGPFLGKGSVNIPTATNRLAKIEILLETGPFFVVRAEGL
jgi:hypothetical protein